MTIEELKQFLTIDRNNLDIELERQGQIFAEAGDLWAEAIKNRDLAEQVLKQLDANLANQCRQGALDKVTAIQITEYIDSNPSHVEQERRYIEYKYEANKLEVLKKGLEQRGHSIRDLRELYLNGYWGQAIPIKKDLAESYSQRYREHQQKG
jgi:hypothetical protein